jgi:hypothetical protein
VNQTPRNGVTPRLTPNARAETLGRFCFYREFSQGFSNTPPPLQVSAAAPLDAPYRRPGRPLRAGCQESLSLSTLPTPGLRRFITRQARDVARVITRSEASNRLASGYVARG